MIKTTAAATTTLLGTTMSELVATELKNYDLLAEAIFFFLQEKDAGRKASLFEVRDLMRRIGYNVDLRDDQA